MSLSPLKNRDCTGFDTSNAHNYDTKSADTLTELWLLSLPLQHRLIAVSLGKEAIHCAASAFSGGESSLELSDLRPLDYGCAADSQQITRC